MGRDLLLRDEELRLWDQLPINAFERRCQQQEKPSGGLEAEADEEAIDAAPAIGSLGK